MKIGLDVSMFNWPGSPEKIGRKRIEIAQTADKLGFFSLWVMDYFYKVGLSLGALEFLASCV